VKWSRTADDTREAGGYRVRRVDGPPRIYVASCRQDVSMIEAWTAAALRDMGREPGPQFRCTAGRTLIGEFPTWDEARAACEAWEGERG